MWAPPFPPPARAPKAENWGPRLLAALVDAVVAWVMAFVLFVVGLMIWLGAAGRFDELQQGAGAEDLLTEDQMLTLGGLLIVGVVIIAWGYLTIFEGASGTTPGKRLLGLWVVDRAYGRCGWGRAAVRNVFKAPAVCLVPANVISALILAGVLALYIVPVATDGALRRRIGDRAAGTIVVKRPKVVPAAVPYGPGGPASRG